MSMSVSMLLLWCLLKRLLGRRSRRVGLGEGHLDLCMVLVYQNAPAKRISQLGFDRASSISSCCTRRELSKRPSTSVQNESQVIEVVPRVFGDDIVDLSYRLSFYQVVDGSAIILTLGDL